MSGKQIHLNTNSENPIIYQLDEKGMAALFTMIEDIVRKVLKEEMNLATEQPMNTDDVAKFLDIDVATVRLKTRLGHIPFGELEPGGHKFYYASKINEKIKGKK